jgi:uncharacterized membrane protein HdeD (DUF308 family)
MSLAAGPAPGPTAPGQYWWLPFAAGLLTLTVGIIALVWPGPTLLVVGVLLGAYLIAWGVIDLVRGIGGAGEMHAGARLALVLLGVAAVLAGLFLLVRPGESVVVVAWAIGFWWVLTGAVQLTRGIVIPYGRAWNIGLGVLGIAAGTVILAQPEIGLAALVLIAGIGLICQGAMEAIAGWQLRELHKQGLA